MLKTIADMHAMQGNSALAEQELFQVLALYRSIHYPYLHYTYDLLTSIYHGLNNYDKALKYALMTIESAQTTRDSLYLGSFNLNLAVLYDELKQWKTAIPYYKKALVLFGESNVIPMVHVIAHSLCSLQIVHESPAAALAYYSQILRQYPLPNRSAEWFYAYMTLAECHLALKNYTLAETYYIKMASIHAGKTPDNATIASYIKIGTFYGIVKNYDKAREYLNQALGMLKRVGMTRGTPSVHLQLFKVDSAQHNYIAAIDHFQKYKSLSDSIFNEKKSQQIANLEIQYNTRKKEQDIDLLTRQNQLQQARIRESDLQRNSIIVGVILLILLLGLIYNRYRLKRRSNQLLEAKQVEINLKNESLVQILLEKEKLLEEKEWMLKEIHHRVKNNLQIISSMLNAQSDFLQDPKALMAIRDSQNRVQAMALIHQRLYQSENLAQVNMPEFVEEIVDYLIDSFTQQASVRAQFDVLPVQLDIALAIPIGLILNEAVTNSLKYAFPNKQPGRIAVVLRETTEQTYQLTISDNGVGLPAGLDIGRSDTLGMTMMRGLSQQIDGQLAIYQDHGVHIQLLFNPKQSATKMSLSLHN
ncbi:tetratricopeptide repeat-containing sensor histidine kinase [Spirosoma aerolatum]|uniref:tetratricopeptide repeat-containing sensor histidine kinase n=1 Tax=Spirosoma aerolatum TaxID=1211326 RepID=UPI0009AC4DE7|nr:tetratricopeptide repeat protein [Spirosoma aerolatum]